MRYLLPVLLFLAVGCSSNRDALTFRDPAQITIARGQLFLPERSPAVGEKFEGTWHLKTAAAIFPADALDPKRYTGHVDEEGNLVIDLNPAVRDDNINLRGKWDRTGYRGNWYHSTLAGAQDKGTFTVETPRPR